MSDRTSWLRKPNGTLVLVLAIVCTIPVWVVQFPPLKDYPNHLLEAYAFANPGDIYARKYLPIPYWLVLLALYAVSRFTSWMVAGKVVLSLSILVFVGGGHYFFTQIRPRLRIWTWLLVIVTYNYFFMSGNVGYYLALGLSAFVLGYWYVGEKRASWTLGPMLVLCTALYFAHGIPFIMAFILVMVCILSRSLLTQKRVVSPLLWKALLCFLPGLLLFAAYLVANDQPSRPGPLASAAEKAFVSMQTVLIDRVEAIPATTPLAALQNGVRLLVLAMAVCAPFLGRRLERSADVPSGPEPASHTGRQAERTVLWILFATSLLLWAIAPIGTLTLVRIDQRVFPYVLLWGLCLLPDPPPIARRVLQGILIAGGSVCLVLTAVLFLQADQVFRNYYVRLLQLPPGKAILSLTEYYPPPPRSMLEMLTPGVEVPYYFSCYYPLARGGICPDLFDTGPVKLARDLPVVTRTWDYGKANRFDFTCQTAISEQMDHLSEYYDIVVLWGKPCIDAGDLLSSYGYQPHSVHREMAIWVRQER